MKEIELILPVLGLESLFWGLRCGWIFALAGVYGILSIQAADATRWRLFFAGLAYCQFILCVL